MTDLSLSQGVCCWTLDLLSDSLIDALNPLEIFTTMKACLTEAIHKRQSEGNAIKLSKCRKQMSCQLHMRRVEVGKKRSNAAMSFWTQRICPINLHSNLWRISNLQRILQACRIRVKLIYLKPIVQFEQKQFQSCVSMSNQYHKKLAVRTIFAWSSGTCEYGFWFV